MYTIYSKPNCGYCKRAKDLLDILGEDFVEFNIEDDALRSQLNERLGYEARTVPQIWDGDKFVGGYTELSAYTR
ncbi:Glutaredoxin-1 [compost metagenome]